MEIKDIVRKAHDNAVKHGFWDPPLPFGTAIALIHSELSEALEEERAGHPWSGITVRKATRPIPVTPRTKRSASSTATKTPVSTETRSRKARPWNWPTR